MGGSKKPTRPPEPLSPREVHALIASCDLRTPAGIRDHALITLLYRSGMRIGEALALRPGDLDFTRHTARLLTTKAGRAQTRGFHASADAALLLWLDARRKIPAGRGSPLFCTLQGGPLSGRQVRAMFARHGARAGIDKRVHPHGMRHTFASQARESGADIVTISRMLGHTSITHTARYIDHLTNADAIERLQTLNLPPLEEP